MASNKNNIYIIEGFDGVGKDYWVDSNLVGKEKYRPNHAVFDKFFGRQQSWAIGFSIFDFLSRINKTSVEIVINRCIATSLVYSEIYNGQIHLHKNLDELIEFYKNNKHFQEANHIHICHKDMDSARKIHSLASGRLPNEEGDEEFQLEGFLDYWKSYCDAEVKFAKYYRLLGIKPQYIRNEYKEDLI